MINNTKTMSMVRPIMTYLDIRSQLTCTNLKKVVLRQFDSFECVPYTVEIDVNRDKLEDDLIELKQYIDSFKDEDATKRNLVFNIIYSIEIEGLTWVQTCSKLDCSNAYIAMVMKQYRELYDEFKKGDSK